MTAAAEPVVSVSGVSKRYGATLALDDVTLDARPGEVVGLIGTNGAGKSTLIKVLSGVTRPSAGTIHLAGTRAEPAGPLEAQAAGVQTVHQNIDDGVVFGTTVAENLLLDSFGRRHSGWFTTRARIRARAAEVARAVRLDLPLDAPVETLPASARQQIVIARALSRRARLLILDEPTSTLSAVEADALMARVREAAAGGVAVLYVSHRLAEIEDLCDRVVVLRDGRVRRIFTAPLDRAAIVEAMLGEVGHVSAAGRETAPGGRGRPVLEAEGVRTTAGGRPFGLVVREGEVLGVTGLVGSGKTELLEQLGGARPLVSGELRVDGRPYRPGHPRAAIAAGVAFAAEERSAQAIVPGWSIRAHVTLPWLRAHSRAGLLSRGSETDSARRVVDLFGVRGAGRAASPDAAIETLSGGNQQKVVVGRWLETSPRVLLLDEPFRGVDVGARADIGRVVREHAAGMAVVVASSDPQEIVELADRVLVLHEGAPTGELPVADVTAERLAALMSGGTDGDPPPHDPGDGTDPRRGAATEQGGER
ncbi:sugar ABC transporter ATP-binding protein [Microtetraspora sp. NBRC 13810]|uniref:sugar ABC transporter ATP-binding protein n=1 Tax=Microtetraspora sp. NBRC 13810 TaxID=3030990 RepID=UPI0024A3FE82|nr:sugar ABC transporter ATP-binding protein [Microtetraspora sp. NBRC 13810]GLW10973.1 sugar ABC transporter ATP-binding protein [Microtetraspora sp. NBRC 13810]